MLRIVVSTALTASVKILWLGAIGWFVTSLFLPCAMHVKVFPSHNSFFTVVYFVVELTQFQRAKETFSKVDPSMAFIFFFINILEREKNTKMMSLILSRSNL